MWSRLRGRREDGLRFRRQQPIGPFIVDFYCAEAKLIVEIDGASHHYKGPDDASRSKWLEQQGYMILRILNDDVLRDDRSCWIGVMRTAYSRVPRLSSQLQEFPSW